MMISKVLSIAGFDGSGGAGLQADLKTFSVFGCYGMTVLTALPIQNTCGVRKCYPIPLSAIQDQLEAIFDDIVPEVIKIGMLFNHDIVSLVASFLKSRAKGTPIVLDPVMVAKSGDALLHKDAIDCLKDELIPLVTIITPNLDEATALTDIRANSPSAMVTVAAKLLDLGPQAVLLKGGHSAGESSDDYFLSLHTKHWLKSPRVMTNNSHGTGCILSAAIAAGIAKGMTILEACKTSKAFLYQALEYAKENKIGCGNGALHISRTPILSLI